MTAIPLSLLAAVIVLRLSGATLNTMTLGGLAIALGEVVDDAIIDVENIFRRLALNKKLPQPLSAQEVTFHASLEVRSAVVYATFIVSLVFLPVFFLGGISGAIFSPPGYHAEYGGEYEAAQEGQRRLFGLGALSLFGIALLLYADFRSWRLCGLMMLSVPFALIGGVAAALASGGTLSLGSFVLPVLFERFGDLG